MLFKNRLRKAQVDTPWIVNLFGDSFMCRVTACVALLPRPFSP